MARVQQALPALLAVGIDLPVSLRFGLIGQVIGAIILFFLAPRTSVDVIADNISIADFLASLIPNVLDIEVSWYLLSLLGGHSLLPALSLRWRWVVTRRWWVVESAASHGLDLACWRRGSLIARTSAKTCSLSDAK